MGWVKVGGTTPATCATYAQAPGGGSGAQSSALHFPGSALPARGGLGHRSGGKGEEAGGKLSEVRSWGRPRAATESHWARLILAPERLFPFLGLG